MSNNNNSGNFFKFKNVQLVRRPNSGRQTQQNTEIRMQGTAEQQFAGIAAAARAEVLNDIDDILTDDDSVDYSPPKQQPLDHKYRYRITFNKCQTLTIQTIAHQKVLQTAHWILRASK